MNFLDENGLRRLWAQIILKLNSKVPDGGTTGQVLKKTETGTEWADAPQTVTIPETTALLKGDGVGGVAAATTDATPTQGSTNPVQSGGVYTALANKLDKTGDGSNATAAFTAASSRTNIATGEKLSVLFGKIAKWFSDLGSLAFKSTVAKTDLASDVQTSLGKADSALQSVPANYRTASAQDEIDNGKQDKITANGILKGDGAGGVRAAVKGADYSEPSVAFTVTLSASGWSGNAQTVSDARFLTGGYAYSVAPDSGSFAAYGESVIYADNVTTAGKMQFHCGEVPTAALTVNILRMEASA